MKPAAIVADEMFPEGAGPYMDIEEVCKLNLMLNYQSYFIILFYDLKKNNWGTVWRTVELQFHTCKNPSIYSDDFLSHEGTNLSISNTIKQT